MSVDCSKDRARLTVQTLLGENGIEVALKCLASLSEKVQRKVNFVIHDDGTLSRDSIRRLRSTLPVDDIVDREEADREVAQRLSSYPNCLDYRKRSNFALKLFDVPLLSSEKQVIFADSDIFFIRPVRDIFDLRNGCATFTSNGHMGNAYSAAFWQVRPLGRLKLVDSLNSGLFCLDKRCYDLGFIERTLDYLSTSRRYWERPYWAEQTCWSAVAAKVGAQIWKFDDIAIPKSDGKEIIIPDGALALHFASSVREALWKVQSQPTEATSIPNTVKARYNTSLRQLKFDLEIYASSVLNSFLGK